MKKAILISICSLIIVGTVKGQTGDKNAIGQTISQFFEWYKKERADTAKTEFPIVTGTASPESRKLVDMKNVEFHLNKYRTNAPVSETFINTLRGKYKKIADTADRYPVYDGALRGFEVDAILSSPDPDEILENLNFLRINKIVILKTKAIATITILDIKMILSLSKLKDKWLVDDLNYY